MKVDANQRNFVRARAISDARRVQPRGVAPREVRARPSPSEPKLWEPRTSDGRIRAGVRGPIDETASFDPWGPLRHLGHPIEFGAEKERDLRALTAGDTFHPTVLPAFEPSFLPNPEPELLRVGRRPPGPVDWSDLNDRGKARYVLEHMARLGETPEISVEGAADYAGVSIEPNGWIELISSKFDSLREAQAFLGKYGWGHIHTSFMRGASPETRAAQATWFRNANLYLWLSGLERGAGQRAEPCWRFSIKGLSVPTAEHLALATRLIGGANAPTSPFSKHLLVALRADGSLYGHRNRIGFELRGGITREKERVLDSLLGGLVFENWGAGEDAPDALPLVHVATDSYYQVGEVPEHVARLIDAHLDGRGSGEAARLEPASRDSVGFRLHGLLAEARFFTREIDVPSRMLGFDQRIATPLLPYESLAWLSGAERTRVLEARSGFIGGLLELERKREEEPVRLAEQVVSLAEGWARRARLGSAFGRWLDGPERRPFSQIRDARSV